ncbi:galactose oxidase [Microthyrium microscopicum]|uniref:Galactose oxidase n=1 Tax=Microthyrium microscopicum TaxID=703497 RepID=A0A6A6TZ94_9PEZI|nr:galactose oxidase [Microthyrium microscopicum]
MAKKDKKSKEVEKKMRNAQKQERKAAKKDKKQKTRGKGEEDSDDEDVDLDAILAEYQAKQELFLKVTEEVSEPPSPRASATIVASPSNENELLLFGGEFFNGSLASFYNDLFVYNVNRDEWKRVTSPNSPLPRSGHAVTRGGNTGGLFLFGGEFSSPKQGTFYHYNDFWRLEPSTREWTRLESKGKSPPSRSGHRMVYFKQYIILFGGFQDTSQQTKYLNDLWIYDCTTYTWHEPKLPAGTGKPDARSSFSFLPHESGCIMFGGYSRVKTTATSQKQVKGGSRPGTQKVTLKPVIHQDTWFLRITPPSSDAPSGTLPAVRWERRPKKPANAPNPPRAGATMCAHRGRGIMFGGVHDVEESEEGIDSEFFNILYAWNVDRNRYFQLTLRRPKTSTKQKASDRSRRDRGKQTEDELLRNLKALEMGAKIDDEEAQNKMQLDEENDNEPAKPAKTVSFEMPHPRFNAQLTVQGDVLYIFGGTFEKGDQEYTLDEMWAIDLNKLDGVREIYKRDVQDWQIEEDSEDDDDEEEDDDEEDSDVDMEDAQSTAGSVPTQVSTTASSVVADEETTLEESSAFTDGLPFPRPFESLREFFDRTKIPWQEIVISDLQKSGDSAHLSPKEISTKGFQRAEDKWWDCREEIRVLEDEQTEAGIGEVVSLADKQSVQAGPGRRR